MVLRFECSVMFFDQIDNCATGLAIAAEIGEVEFMKDHSAGEPHRRSCFHSG